MSETNETPTTNTAQPLAIAATHVSFYGKVKAEFQKIFGHASSFTQTAAATMTFVAPLISTVVALAAPEVALILAKIQSAFAAASVLVKSAGSQPTIVAYLDTVRDNIKLLENVLQIKNPETQQKIEASVALIVGELDAVLGALAT